MLSAERGSSRSMVVMVFFKPCEGKVSDFRVLETVQVTKSFILDFVGYNMKLLDGSN